MGGYVCPAPPDICSCVADFSFEWTSSPQFDDHIKSCTIWAHQRNYLPVRAFVVGFFFFLIKAERQSLITMKKKNTRHSKRPHCGSLASLNCTVDEGNQWLLVPPALFKMRAGKITNEEEGTVQWHRTSTYSVYCNTTTLSTHNQPIMVRQQQTN